jgi:hypothetical protein
MQELASLLQVPVLTTGKFQGSRGPEVEMTEEGLDRVIAGSNRLRPYLDNMLLSGQVVPQNEDILARIGKPLPAAININHEATPDDKIRDSLKGVETSFSKAMIADPETGDLKPWIVQNFEDVPPVQADFIRRFFPLRSVELLAMNDPETGETYNNGVIISTAFLDKATPPAVPGQSAHLHVEFAASESPLFTFSTDQPIIMEGKRMEPTTQKTPDELATLQAQAEKQAQELAELKAMFADKEAAELKEKEEKDALKQQLSTLQAAAEAGETEKYLSMLSAPHPHDGKVYTVSPAFLKEVESLIKDNGVINLSEGQSYKGEMYKKIDNLVTMAMEGNIVVCLSNSTTTPINPEAKPKTESDILKEAAELSKKEGISEYDALKLVRDKEVA